MGELLKFVTLDGGLRKKKNAKNVFVFCKIDSILRPFWLSFGLNDLF